MEMYAAQKTCRDSRANKAMEDYMAEILGCEFANLLHLAATGKIYLSIFIKDEFIRRQM